MKYMCKPKEQCVENHIHLNSPITIRKYDDKCKVNLAVEYSYIERYSKISLEL